MTDHPVLKRLSPRLVVLPCLAWLVALVAAMPAEAQQEPPVTNEGFDAKLADATLYAPIPLRGVVGQDCPPEAVNASLKAAADNPHIKHAVFMINSESGWPLENEHIGSFASKLTITAVVRDAIAPAIFPVFFADNVFMIDSALVGGLPLHEFTLPGSKEVTAKQVGILSSMLASAAQSRGHSDAVAYAMIDKNKKLYYWREGGEAVLSNDKPSDTSGLKGFRQIKSALPGSTLTLNHKTALEIGFAKTIDSFDHFIVGEYLDQPNWTPANQFGRVANEIGSVIAEIEPLRKDLHEVDKRSQEAGRNNSSGYRQYKKSLDETIVKLDMIKNALEDVYNNHPEKHIYFAGPEGKTLVADPEKWNADYSETRKNLNRATGLLRQMTKDLRDIGGDPEFLYDLNQRMETINEHLSGIGRYGNAAYWADHAKPDLPDDIYG
ncbi:MAG: hypothetical protein KTR15_09720 [Phycisphaeraceae bacterium]|nr:hypothetical protein [Phycisphaeraceae bacterium]